MMAQPKRRTRAEARLDDADSVSIESDDSQKTLTLPGPPAHKKAKAATPQPAETLTPELPKGAWVRAGNGWVTGRDVPKSFAELCSWSADVVISLQHGHHVQKYSTAALKTSAVRQTIPFQVSPINLWDYTTDDCIRLSRVVASALSETDEGSRVAIYCRPGQHRTSGAIYLLLRTLGMESSECLVQMKQMSPIMREEFQRTTGTKALQQQANQIFADRKFSIERRFL